MKKIVCISDTHLRHGQVIVPEGDILLFAGDFTSRGDLEDVFNFCRWSKTLPHAHKIMIGGNHDFCLEPGHPFKEDVESRLKEAGWTYLLDEEVTVEGFRIYGSPWTPTFYNWAFMRDRGEPIARIWQGIPAGLDFLVTHGPPIGMLDCTEEGVHAGCEELRKKVLEVVPRFHVFGHIHEGSGYQFSNNIHFINASVLDRRYKPNNSATVLTFFNDKRLKKLER